MAIRWDAARAKSQQPARKYRPCAPVGKWQSTASHFTDNVERRHLGGREFGTCVDCGYHVCSCPPKRIPEWHGNPMMRSMAGRLALFEALAARDPEDPDGPPLFSPRQRAEAINLLLTGEVKP